MPELIEAGYIYIAKPPLYKLKQGSSERYIEKDSELEEILLSDKLEKIVAFDRHATQFKLTEARWQRYSRLLKQYQGWSSTLRAEYGHDTVGFLEESGILDEQVDSVDAAISLIEREGIENAPYETTLLRQDDEVLVVRAVETKSGLARALRIPKRLFGAQDYRQFTRVHGQLIELAGRAPFTVKLGETTADAVVVRGAARGGADGRAEGHHAAALQGPRRDERRAAARHDDGSRDAHARAGVDRGRRPGRPHLLDAHGRHGRAAPPVHRGQRPSRRQPRRMRLRSHHPAPTT